LSEDFTAVDNISSAIIYFLELIENYLSIYIYFVSNLIMKY